MTLDDIGILCGTDKSSLAQGYLPHYDRLLGHLRDAAFNLIEVGVHNGASLQTWAEYFPRAAIVGIDIEPRAAQSADGRVNIRIGSQADPEFLEAVAGEFPPLIVIDDGSHRADHQIATFGSLFPKLLPGGCYICEDLTVAEDSRHLGNSAILGVDFFAGIVRGLMGRGPALSYAEEIARFDIFPGAIAIWKAEPADPLFRIDRKAELAERSEQPEALMHLAEYLIRYGDAASAERAARRAVDRLPNNAWAYHKLARALKKGGDVEGAVAAAERARDLKPDHPEFERLLEKLRA